MIGGALGAAIGCGASGFVCADDPQCGAQGVCEPEGWCSFPDDDCATGRRFGEHAGGGVASRCVPPQIDSSSSASSGPASSSGGITVASADESTAAMRDTETEAGPTTIASDDGTPSSTGEPVDPELLVWLSFDDAAAPFADGNGNARDGTCDATQCPAVVPTASGGMLRFDGVDDRLSIADDDALRAPSALTLAAWIEVDALSLPTYQDVVAKTYGDSNSNSWGIGFPNDSTELRMVMHDGAATVPVGGIEWPGGSHHVAGTWDGALARLYLDGAQIAEVPLAAIAADAHAVLIGADVNAGLEGNYFGGTLDDLRIYGRALAEDEIVALAGR